MSRTVEREVLHWRPDAQSTEAHQLVGEAPLIIRVGDETFSTGMRTPGEEEAHAAGFCLSLGVVTEPNHIEAVNYCVEGETHCVRVGLTETGREQLARWRTWERPDRAESAGEAVDRLVRTAAPFSDREPVLIGRGIDALLGMRDIQPLRRATRASHATAVFSREFKLMVVAEDVGRHNGLEKALGRLLLDHRLDQAGALVLSSRISFDLVQKAARARLPVIFSVSRPTSLAVELAEALGMALVCLAPDDYGFVFCGKERLDFRPAPAAD
jgi:FdhD protein